MKRIFSLSAFLCLLPLLSAEPLVRSGAADYEIDLDLEHQSLQAAGSTHFAGGLQATQLSWWLELYNSSTSTITIDALGIESAYPLSSVSLPPTSVIGNTYSWSSLEMGPDADVEVIAQTDQTAETQIPLVVTRDWSPRVLSESGDVTVELTIIPQSLPSRSTSWQQLEVEVALSNHFLEGTTPGAQFANLTFVDEQHSTGYLEETPYLENNSMVAWWEIDTPPDATPITITVTVHYELLPGTGPVQIEPRVYVGGNLSADLGTENWSADGDLDVGAAHGSVSVSPAAQISGNTLPWLAVLFPASARDFGDIVGAWWVPSPYAVGDMLSLTFYQNGTYGHYEESLDGSGAEYGTFSYYPESGRLIAEPLVDLNGDIGLSHWDSLSETATVNGDTLTLGTPQDNVSLHRVGSVISPLVGGWTDLRNGPETFLNLTFFPPASEGGNSFYIHFEDESDDPAENGVEFGTYTHDNQTGQLAVSILHDDNSTSGLSAWAAPQPTPSVFIADDTLAVDGVDTLVRVGSDAALPVSKPWIPYDDFAASSLNLDKWQPRVDASTTAPALAAGQVCFDATSDNGESGLYATAAGVYGLEADFTLSEAANESGMEVIFVLSNGYEGFFVVERNSSGALVIQAGIEDMQSETIVWQSAAWSQPEALNTTYRLGVCFDNDVVDFSVNGQLLATSPAYSEAQLVSIGVGIWHEATQQVAGCVDNVDILQSQSSGQTSLTINPEVLSEEDGSAQFVLTLAQPAGAGGVNVELGLSGTAQLGQDYQLSHDGSALPTLSPFVVTIPQGHSVYSVDLVPIDDAVAEIEETVTLAVQSIDGSSADFSATATIDYSDIAYFVLWVSRHAINGNPGNGESGELNWWLTAPEGKTLTAAIFTAANGTQLAAEIDDDGSEASVYVEDVWPGRDAISLAELHAFMEDGSYSAELTYSDGSAEIRSGSFTWSTWPAYPVPTSPQHYAEELDHSSPLMVSWTGGEGWVSLSPFNGQGGVPRPDYFESQWQPGSGAKTFELPVALQDDQAYNLAILNMAGNMGSIADVGISTGTLPDFAAGSDDLSSTALGAWPDQTIDMVEIEAATSPLTFTRTVSRESQSIPGPARAAVDAIRVEDSYTDGTSEQQWFAKAADGSVYRIKHLCRALPVNSVSCLGSLPQLILPAGAAVGQQWYAADLEAPFEFVSNDATAPLTATSGCVELTLQSDDLYRMWFLPGTGLIERQIQVDERINTIAVLIDADDDGHGAHIDCDDANPGIHPDAVELADGVDNDCNGLVDDIWADYDSFTDTDLDLSKWQPRTDEGASAPAVSGGQVCFDAVTDGGESGLSAKLPGIYGIAADFTAGTMANDAGMELFFDLANGNEGYLDLFRDGAGNLKISALIEDHATESVIWQSADWSEPVALSTTYRLSVVIADGVVSVAVNEEIFGQSPVIEGAEPDGFGIGIWYGASQEVAGCVDNVAILQHSVSYTVSYDVNGATGAAPPDQIKSYGVDLTLADAGQLALTGHSFAGWNTAADGSGTGYPAGTTYSADADLTLYAQWSVNSYTISFDSAGGSAVSAISQDFGSAVSTPAPPSRTGFTFAGWLPELPATIPAENITVVAQWTPITYDIVYDANGATTGSTPAPQSKSFGVDLALAENSGNLALSDAIFIGWNSAPDGSGTSYATGATYAADSSVTLYAHWHVPVVLSIADLVTPGMDTGKTVDVSVNTPSDIWSLNLPIGYDPSLLSVTAVTNIGTGRTDDAVFNAIVDSQAGEIRIFFDPDIADPSAAILAGSGPIMRITFDVLVSGPQTTQVTCNPGYQGGGAIQGFDPALDTCTPGTVEIQQVTYPIFYNANGATEGTAPDTQYKDHGIALTLADNSGSLARTGYTFSGWNTAADGSGTSYATAATYSGNALLQLHAEWSINTYTISFDSAGGSAVSAISQDFGSAVSTPAPPSRTGFTFAGWLPELPATISAENITVVAQWTPITYDIVYDANGATTGSIPAPQSKSFGVDLALAENSGNLALSDAIFIGWNTAPDGSGTSYATGATYAADSSVTLYAHWHVPVVLSIADLVTPGMDTGKTVDVSVNTPSDIWSLNLPIGYDPSLLSVTAVTNIGTGRTDDAVFNAIVDSQAGEIRIFFDPDIADPSAAILAGSGPIMRITFDVLVSGPQTTQVTCNPGYQGGGAIQGFDPALDTCTPGTVEIQQVTYPIFYNANGATEGTAPDTQYKDHGIALTLADNSGSLARTGYTFSGWNTAADGSGTSYAAAAIYSGNALLQLHAEWTLIPADFALDSQPSQAAVMVDEGDTQGFVIAAINAVPPYSYQWSLDGQSQANNTATYDLQPAFDTVAHPDHSKAVVLTVLVSDSSTPPQHAQQSWTVTVNDVDRLPPAPTLSLAPAAPTTLDDITAGIQQESDPDGDSITHDVSWTLIDSAARSAISGNPLSSSETQRGDLWRVSVTARTTPYGGIAFAADPVSATVLVVNSPPTAQDLTVPAVPGQPVKVVLPVSDPDNDDGNDALRFRFTTIPETGVLKWLDRNSGTISYTAAPIAVGSSLQSLFAEFTVTDTSGVSSTAAELTFELGGWSLPIDVIGAQIGALALGDHPAATEGMDAWLDRPVPPPVDGPDLWFDIDGDAVSEDFRPDDWELVIDSGDDETADVLLSWSLARVPASGLQLLETTPGRSDGIRLDMAQENRLRISGSGQRTFTIKRGSSAEIEVAGGWSLLGLPLQPEDASPNVILGDGLTVLGFDGDAYFTPQSLLAGVGYYVFNPGVPRSVSISGVPALRPALHSGWNLIAGRYGRKDRINAPLYPAYTGGSVLGNDQAPYLSYALENVQATSASVAPYRQNDSLSEGEVRFVYNDPALHAPSPFTITLAGDGEPTYQALNPMALLLQLGASRGSFWSLGSTVESSLLVDGRPASIDAGHDAVSWMQTRVEQAILGSDSEYRAALWQLGFPPRLVPPRDSRMLTALGNTATALDAAIVARCCSMFDVLTTFVETLTSSEDNRFGDDDEDGTINARDDDYTGVLWRNGPITVTGGGDNAEISFDPKEL